MSGKLVTVTLWGEEVSARRGCHGEAVGTQVSRRKLESFSHPLIPIDPLQVGAVIGFLRRSAGSRRLAPRASSNESDLFSSGVIPLLACGGAAAAPYRTLLSFDQTVANVDPQ